MGALERLDIELFFAINSRHSPFFDTVFYWISNAYAWIPVYALLFILLVRAKGLKTACIHLALVLAAAGLADLASVYLFKFPVARYRPSQNLNYGHLVHLVNDHKGGLYGFVSSHAANFGVWTTLLFLYFKPHWGWKKAALLFMALVLVCYSRVYTGVHYPADVACGSLLGIAIGLMVYVASKKLRAM